MPQKPDLASFMGRSPRLAPVAMVCTALLWSTGGIFIKLVDAHPMAISGIRCAIALLLMLAFTPRPVFRFTLPQIATALAYATCMTTFVIANKLTTSANAIFLQYSAPVWVALSALFLPGERLRPRDLVALVVVLGGIVLFFAGDLQPGNLWGNLIAILSGLAFALTFIFGRMQKAGGSAEAFMLAHFLAFLAGLPFLGSISLGGNNILGLVSLGILQLGISSIIFTAAVPHVPALAGILIVTLEPVMSPVWVFLGQGEVPATTSLIGGGVIIAAVSALQILDFLRPGRQNSPTCPTNS